MGGLILAGYALGWLVTAILVARQSLEQDARRELASRDARYADAERLHHKYPGVAADPPRLDESPLVDGENRGMAFALGSLVGLVWPISVPLLLLYLLLRRGLLTAGAERVYADRVELARLRTLAKDHGLQLDVSPADPTELPDGTIWCGTCMTRHPKLNHQVSRLDRRGGR